MPVTNAAYVYSHLDSVTKILSIFVVVPVNKGYLVDFSKTVPAIPATASTTVRFDLITAFSTSAALPPALQTYLYNLDLKDPKWQNCDRFDVVVDGDTFNATRVFFDDCDKLSPVPSGNIALDCPYLALRKGMNNRLPKVLIPTTDHGYTSSAAKSNEVPASTIAPVQNSIIDLDRLVGQKAFVPMNWLEPGSINAYSYVVIGNTVEDSPSYYFEVVANTPAAAAGGGRKSKQRSGRAVATMSLIRRFFLWLANLFWGCIKFILLTIRRIIFWLFPRRKK